MRSRLIGREDVARALNTTVEDLESVLAHLKQLGFPDPVSEDGNHWAVSDLLDWIVQRQEELVGFVSHISNYIDQ
ncbi:MAG: hypothetical protein JNM45_02940 [Rhizobiales bacterium]|nr:hypothetical protein [Hyphomicrobiales bacterium]